MQDETFTKIVFELYNQDAAPSFHVHGAIGGRISDGCIRALLYSEHPRVPAEQEGTIDPDTGRATLVDAPPHSGGVLQWQRRAECAITMTPQQARDLGMWLIAQSEPPDATPESQL